MSDATATYLVDTAGRLWPPPTFALLGQKEFAQQRHETDREFLLLPNGRMPRLCVPVGLPAVAAASMRRYSHGLTMRERIVRSLMANVLRTGALESVLRSRLRLQTPEGCVSESIEDYLANVFGQEVVVTLGVGAPRANQKPVLQALSMAGTSLGYVKVGDTDVARGLVAHEAAALVALRHAELRTVKVPTLLHVGEWHGLSVMIQTTLETGVRRWRSRRYIPLQPMAEVAAASGVRHQQLDQSFFWKRIMRTPKELTDANVSETFLAVLEAAAERYGKEIVLFGAWHGDWTEWNMAWQRHSVSLWDWERYDPDVPVGLDPAHYVLQSWLMAGTRSGLTSLPRQLNHVLKDFGVHPDVITDLYLIQLAARYLLASQEAIGGPLRPRARWLLSALQQRMSVQ